MGNRKNPTRVTASESRYSLMEFMREFATSVTVLAQGSVLAEGSVADIQSDPAVREVYLGTAEMENDR